MYVSHFWFLDNSCFIIKWSVKILVYIAVHFLLQGEKAPPVSYSAVPLQSIDCFCSSRRLIASLLARFALVRRRNCSCSYSHQFRFSPSIVYALLLARSASVRRLFLLFSSINSFSSRQFRSSPSIVSAVLVARSASVRRLFLLF